MKNIEIFYCCRKFGEELIKSGGAAHPAHPSPLTIYFLSTNPTTPNTPSSSTHLSSFLSTTTTINPTLPFHPLLDVGRLLAWYQI